MTIKHTDFYLFEDMELYNKEFNRKLYMHKSKKEIIDEFREYHNTNLPVDLTTWMHVNQASESLYSEDMSEYVNWVYTYIGVGLFGRFDKMSNVQVIAIHMSKSIRLPVMELTVKELGVRFTFRYNFQDWVVSVESIKDIVFDFGDIFTDDNHHLCQGFPSERVFGKYIDNNKKFTVCIKGDNRMETFMNIIKEILSDSRITEEEFDDIVH